MHHVEGIQCGLPVIYHRQGGGIVEHAQRYGLEYTEDLGSVIENMRSQYADYRRKVLQSAPASGDDMCLRAIDIIQQLCVA